MMQRVLMDVNGIIANFIKLYVDSLLEATGIHKKETDIDQWDTGEALGLDKTQRAAVHSRLMLPGRAFMMKPYPGAVEAVIKLATVTDLYFVTSPFPSPTWVYDRDQWLQHHFGELGKKVVHTTHKYVCTGSYLVDDKPDNIREWCTHNRLSGGSGVGLLWDAHWNQDADDLIRVFDWDDLMRIVTGGVIS